jgi:hypothetical protein
MTVQGSREVPPVSADDRIIRLKVNEVWHKFYVGHDIEEADTLSSQPSPSKVNRATAPPCNAVTVHPDL